MGKIYRDKRTVNVGLTDTQLLGPNLKRRAVIISAPATNRFSVSVGDTPAVLDGDITVYPATLPLKLEIDDVGEGICEGIRAISAVGAQNVNVIDVMRS